MLRSVRVVPIAVCALLGVGLLAGPARSAPPPPAPETNVLRSRTIDLDESILAAICKPIDPTQPIPVLVLQLFDDVVVRAEATLVEPGAEPTTIHWRGSGIGDSGTDVSLSATNACDGQTDNTDFAASIRKGGHQYAMHTAAEPGKVTITEDAPTADPVQSDEDDTAPGFSGPSGDARKKHGPGKRKREHRADCAEKDVAVIDVLMMYTTGALQNAGDEAGVKSRINTAVDFANKTYANSQVKARIRVVGVEKSVYGQEQGETESAFDAMDSFDIRPKSAAVQEAERLRDERGADLVTFWTATGSGGRSQLPDMPGPSTSTADTHFLNAFAIPVYNGKTFVHETAHNMGVHHEWGLLRSQEYGGVHALHPPYNYNHGYVPPSKQWASIMAYQTSCAPKSIFCEQIPYFSNPRLTYHGEALGVPEGKPDPADAARFLNMTGPIVAAYRGAKTTPVLCGLTLKTEPAEAGTATAAYAGPYTPGSTTTVTATAKEGYVFKEWVKSDGTSYSSQRRTQFKVDADAGLTAKFEQGQTPRRRLTIANGRPEGGSVTTSPAGTEFAQGTEVLLTATPSAGYAFEGWWRQTTSSPDMSTYGETLTVATVLEEDTVLTPNFVVANKTITIRKTPDDGGVVELAPEGPYYVGQRVFARVKQYPGFQPTTVTVNGRSADLGPMRVAQVNVVDGDNVVTVEFSGSRKFELDLYAAPDESNGTVTAVPAGEEDPYGQIIPAFTPGATVKVTAAPAAGKKFVRWVAADGSPYTDPDATNPIREVVMNSDLTLFAEFAAAAEEETFAEVLTRPGWKTLGTSAAHRPCLTAASQQTPADSLAMCDAVRDQKATADAASAGVLQVTDESTQAVEGVILTRPQDASKGLKIQFDQFQHKASREYNGDGLLFFLVDGATDPSATGAPGGSLGYLNLQGAHLGFGFDLYGHFSNPYAWPKGDRGPGFSPNSIVARGAASTNYQYLVGRTLDKATQPLAGTERTASRRSVAIEITTDNRLTVTVDFHDGKGPQLILDRQDLTAQGQPALPSTVKVGFTAASGAATSNHEIRNFKIGPAP